MKIFDLLKSNEYSNKKVLELILCFCLGITREQIHKNLEIMLTKYQLSKISKYYKQYSIHNKPIEYIFGECEFYGEKYKVNHNVLIPRRETEFMIEFVLKSMKQSTKSNFELFDIGTGSGIIGISLLKNIEKKINKIYMTDISQKCLLVAKHNARKILKDTSKIVFLTSNLMDFFTKIKYSQKNIIIVANLPYIEEQTFFTQVEDNVKKREPTIAFIGGENDGLGLYRQLMNQIMSFLNNKLKDKNISMFFELDSKQSNILINNYTNFFNHEVYDTLHHNIKILKLFRIIKF